jgi:hypothetical protein
MDFRVARCSIRKHADIPGRLTASKTDNRAEVKFRAEGDGNGCLLQSEGTTRTQAEAPFPKLYGEKIAACMPEFKVYKGVATDSNECCALQQ